VKPPRCTGCGHTVLELEGQFEMLDSYYVDDGEPPLDSTGGWHLRCLLASPYGAAWFAARRRSYVGVRGYDVMAESAVWTVVRNPRTKEAVALAPTGEMTSLVFTRGRPRRVDGGAIYRRDEEYNLELDDRDAIQAIQDALTSVGTLPILALLEVLGIADRTVHPEALEGSVFRFDRALRRDWGPDFVAARADYGVFVPTALEPYVTRGR